MLKLLNIVKDYQTGDTKVTALKGISVNLRKNEFVSILGHSGCGKTTLLNIIGGLDQYTSGDLIIANKSTKDFNDRDWDTYRNHRVGFVFQNYNLIMHQSILSNVELALTLSGVSKSERKQRAKEALIKVGLGDQIGKRPNQLSGGQMQRVAIARALVNNPEILLADEPTGALDSETSIQVMDLLKEIASDRLVVMVTHNPELAKKYSTRIIKLSDGEIIDDTNPCSDDEEQSEHIKIDKSIKTAKKSKKADKKTSMSFFTALSLSLNNLLTKKMRTFLTSFAGSIGIIGIALILSLSSGFQAYIDSIQRETLTSYPITIESANVDLSSMMESMASKSPKNRTHELDKVYSNALSATMMESFTSEVWNNNLTEFKKYLESDDCEIKKYTSSIQYTYAGSMNIYSSDTKNGINKVYPSPIINMMQSMMGNMDFGGISMDTSTMASYEKYYNSWQEIINNQELLNTQYEVIQGNWPKAYNEVVLIIDKNNEISDLALQGLGVTTTDDMIKSFSALQNGEKIKAKSFEIEYKDIIGKKFKLVLQPDYFDVNESTGFYEDKSEDDDFVANLINKGEDITIVGIVRPAEGSLMVETTGAIGYTNALTEYVVNATNNCDLVKEQKQNPDTDVFTSLPFPKDDTDTAEKSDKNESTSSEIDVFEKPITTNLDYNGNKLSATPTANNFDFSSLPNASKEDVFNAIDERLTGDDASQTKRMVELMIKQTLSADERKELISLLDKMMEGQTIEGYGTMSGKQAYSYLKLMDKNTKLKMLYAMITAAPTQNAEEITAPQEPEEVNEPEPEPLAKSQAEALEMLGVGDLATPTSINIYPIDFEAKDAISEIIKQYNADNESNGKEKNNIKYTDYIGLLLTSVTKIVNIISYVLIAFVAISLVVSSIMIGIITYISVLERTKEIGILRAIGASKHNISTVFNAETLIVGFVSGAIGIGATLLMNIPINMLIKKLTTIPSVAQLPTEGAVILVCISMFLTLIAGLIPSRIASKKDPVIALRSE